MTMLDQGWLKYLELLKQTLTAAVYEESAWRQITPASGLKRAVVRALGRRGLKLIKAQPFDPAARKDGADWPMFGFSMAGLKRMTNVQDLVESVVAEQVPGDFVECGVWRGGSSIFARAALDAYGAHDRIVWLADSFEGMPSPTDVDRAVDKVDLAGVDYLIATVADVKANFEKFGMADRVREGHVRFVKGWFKDSLPTAPIGQIAILRLDGDHYSSTMDALTALYDRVVPGGYIIVDDYNAWPGCKKAVTEFRAARAIDSEIHRIDEIGVYWRREAATSLTVEKATQIA